MLFATDREGNLEVYVVSTQAGTAYNLTRRPGPRPGRVTRHSSQYRIRIVHYIVIPEAHNSIAPRFQLGTSILHIGGARFPILPPLRFTLNAREALKVAQALQPRTVIPIHYEGWKHFRESGAEARKVFDRSEFREKIRWLPLGTPVEVEI